MTSSSPVASLTGSEVLKGPLRPNHPSYERLIVKLFRLAGRPKQPLHLTSIRAQFVKLYSDRYWFPPSWPRHLYQRLREMERKETVESSGPGNLYFRLSPSVYQGRKARRAQKGRRSARSAAEDATYVLASETPNLLASTALTDMSRVEQSLHGFKPLEDILRIEGRLGAQLTIVDRLMRVLASGDPSELPGIQAELDDLVLGHDRGQELSMQEHINRFEATLDGLRSYQAAGKLNDELSSAVEALTDSLKVANRMGAVHVGDALLTVSTLIAGLLTTVQALRTKIEGQEGSDITLRAAIDTLQKELEDTRALLAGKDQAERLADEELGLVLECEEGILESTRETTMKMTSLSNRLESDLTQLKGLREQESSHYESIIDSLRKEKEHLAEAKEQEVVFVQSELASVNEQYSLAASRISELDMEILDMQHQIDGQQKSIEQLSQQLAEQVKVSEDLEGKLSEALRVGEEVGGAWSEMDRRMSGLLYELAALSK